MTQIQRNTHPYEGTRIGDLTRCRVCGKAIQLVRSRNPDTQVDHDFWVHYAPPGGVETHKAIQPRVFTPTGLSRPARFAANQHQTAT